MVSFFLVAGLAVALFVIFNRQISTAFGSSAEGITDFFGGAGRGITNFFDQFTDPLDIDGSRTGDPGSSIRSDTPIDFDPSPNQRNALTSEELQGATSIRQDETGAVFVNGEQVRDSLPNRTFLDDVGEFFTNAFTIPEAFGDDEGLRVGDTIAIDEVDGSAAPDLIETPDEPERIISDPEPTPQTARQDRDQRVGRPAQSEINNQQFQTFSSDSRTRGVVRESELTEVELRTQRQERANRPDITEARRRADESRERAVARLEERQRQANSRADELQLRADRANRANLGSNFGLSPEEIALRATGGNINNF